MQTSLNILIIARFAGQFGGADVYTEELACHLAERGHQVRLFCHSATESVHELCDVIQLSDPDFGRLKALWRLAPLLYQRHWRKFLARHSALKPDLVVCSLPLSTRDVIATFPGVPLIYLPHSRIAPAEAVAQLPESKLLRQIAHRLYAKCEDFSLRKANTTVRFTAKNETELRNHYRLPAQTPFDIVPPAVRQIKEVPKQKIGDPVRLVTVSRLIKSKNLEWLFEQLAIIESDAWHLTVVGDGPERDRLESLAKNLKIADRVEFAGFCTSMQTVYELADLHVFPSLRESYGLVILEAMAFGVPTLAFRPDGKNINTASDEIIEDGLNGLLAGGQAEFNAILSQSIADPSGLLRLGENARQKVIKQNRWETVTSVWEKIFDRLVQPALV